MTGKKRREKLSDHGRISLDEEEHMAAFKSRINFAVCWIWKRRCTVWDPRKTRSSGGTSRKNSPPPARLSRLTQGRDRGDESHLFLPLLITHSTDGNDNQSTWNWISISLFSFYVMCMGVWPTRVPVHHVYAWCWRRPEGGVGSPGTGFTDSGEPSCWRWE